MNPIEECKNWLQEVVIAHNFCPFAKAEFDRGRVRFVLAESDNTEDLLHQLIAECAHLDEHSDTETTLLIYPHGLDSFDEFLDFVELATDLLHAQDYEGVYQLASFHPDYCFEGEEENDAANYTNRSPYPMLHLIREKSIENALKHYPQPERIPENNIELAQQKGSAYFQDLLHKIKNK